jgi:hypothetical protein
VVSQIALAGEFMLPWAKAARQPPQSNLLPILASPFFPPINLLQTAPPSCKVTHQTLHTPRINFMALKKSELYSSLWSGCDELRGGMDASQYKDYVLVLLFIKYISDK